MDETLRQSYEFVLSELQKKIEFEEKELEKLKIVCEYLKKHVPKNKFNHIPERTTFKNINEQVKYNVNRFLDSKFNEQFRLCDIVNEIERFFTIDKRLLSQKVGNYLYKLRVENKIETIRFEFNKAIYEIV